MTHWSGVEKLLSIKMSPRLIERLKDQVASGRKLRWPFEGTAALCSRRAEQPELLSTLHPPPHPHPEAHLS